MDNLCVFLHVKLTTNTWIKSHDNLEIMKSLNLTAHARRDDQIWKTHERKVDSNYSLGWHLSGDFLIKVDLNLCIVCSVLSVNEVTPLEVLAT